MQIENRRVQNGDWLVRIRLSLKNSFSVKKRQVRLMSGFLSATTWSIIDDKSFSGCAIEICCVASQKFPAESFKIPLRDRWTNVKKAVELNNWLINCTIYQAVGENF